MATKKPPHRSPVADHVAIGADAALRGLAEGRADKDTLTAALAQREASLAARDVTISKLNDIITDVTQRHFTLLTKLTDGADAHAKIAEIAAKERTEKLFIDKQLEVLRTEIAGRTDAITALATGLAVPLGTLADIARVKLLAASNEGDPNRMAFAEVLFEVLADPETSPVHKALKRKAGPRWAAFLNHAKTYA